MSLRVLVIPEDPTHNGYILKPLVEMLLSAAGKPTATVEILENPRLGGFDEACHAIRHDLASRYGFMDLWLFFPDADRATPAAMRDLERRLDEAGVKLLCSPAEPELEVYACVAYAGKKGGCKAMREHPRFKEQVFGPLLERHGHPNRPGGGRREMTRESIRRRSRLFAYCPELDRLRHRIQDSVSG